jgi:hypothetical protein
MLPNVPATALRHPHLTPGIGLVCADNVLHRVQLVIARQLLRHSPGRSEVAAVALASLFENGSPTNLPASDGTSAPLAHTPHHSNAQWVERAWSSQSSYRIPLLLPPPGKSAMRSGQAVFKNNGEGTDVAASQVYCTSSRQSSSWATPGAAWPNRLVSGRPSASASRPARCCHVS